MALENAAELNSLDRMFVERLANDATYSTPIASVQMLRPSAAALAIVGGKIDDLADGTWRWIPTEPTRDGHIMRARAAVRYSWPDGARMRELVAGAPFCRIRIGFEKIEFAVHGNDKLAHGLRRWYTENADSGVVPAGWTSEIVSPSEHSVYVTYSIDNTPAGQGDRPRFVSVRDYFPNESLGKYQYNGVFDDWRQALTDARVRLADRLQAARTAARRSNALMFVGGGPRRLAPRPFGTPNATDPVDRATPRNVHQHIEHQARIRRRIDQIGADYVLSVYYRAPRIAAAAATETAEKWQRQLANMSAMREVDCAVIEAQRGTIDEQRAEIDRLARAAEDHRLLQRKYDRAVQMYNDRIGEIAALTDINDELTDQLSTAESLVADLRDQLITLRGENESLRMRLNHSENELSTYDSALEQQERIEDSLTDAAVFLGAQLNEAHATLDRLGVPRTAPRDSMVRLTLSERIAELAQKPRPTIRRVPQARR